MKWTFSSIQELVAFYKDHYLTVDGMMTLVTSCPPPKIVPTPCKKFVVHTGINGIPFTPAFVY